jgi:zinc knuckle protein
MRPFNVRIVANNQAGTWQSWPEKIAAIKAFYASVCDLNIELIATQLTPQFAPYQPSSTGTTYRVDEAWYEANVLLLAPGDDIVLFVVPPTDHPSLITLMGLEYYQQGKPGELTVFSDETSHTYIFENGADVDQGETVVNYGCHEIAHYFYALLAKTDNTHLYFFAGTPEKVLADFNFDEAELGWYQQLVQDLEEELGLLKAREIPPNGDLTPSQSQKTPPQSVASPETTQPTIPARITQWAAIIAKEEGANPDLHNPGNLGYSTLTASWGATKGPAKTDGGFLCQFADETAGLTALCNFLVLGCEDQLLDFHAPEARTLAGFTKIYAGNPPQGYIDAIVQAMGGEPRAPRAPKPAGPKPKAKPARAGTRICKVCGKPGHMAKTCPKGNSRGQKSAATRLEEEADSSLSDKVKERVKDTRTAHRNVRFRRDTEAGTAPRHPEEPRRCRSQRP